MAEPPKSSAILRIILCFLHFSNNKSALGPRRSRWSHFHTQENKGNQSVTKRKHRRRRGRQQPGNPGILQTNLMANLPIPRQVRKDGKIRKLKRKQRFRVSKYGMCPWNVSDEREDDDKLTRLARIVFYIVVCWLESLSLQNGHVESSLKESLSGIHDMATGALTLNCEKHHSRMYLLLIWVYWR
jgi:hypothetical protein